MKNHASQNIPVNIDTISAAIFPCAMKRTQ